MAALAIAATTTLILVALSHPPLGAAAMSMWQQLARLVAAQQQAGLVHGVIIVLLAVLAGAYGVFGTMLGERRPAVRLASATYRAGCSLMVLAMLLDGYVTPQVAAAFIDGPAGDVPFVFLLLRCVGVLIQVLAKAGFLAMCVACLAWSCALLVERPRRPWSTACIAAGLLAAALPAGVILGTSMQLAPASLMLLFGAHALWNLMVALLLHRSSSAAIDHPAAPPAPGHNGAAAPTAAPG